MSSLESIRTCEHVFMEPAMICRNGCGKIWVKTHDRGFYGSSSYSVFGGSVENTARALAVCEFLNEDIDEVIEELALHKPTLCECMKHVRDVLRSKAIEWAT